MYELQLSRQISVESMHKDLAETFKNFITIDDEVIGFLRLNMHLHVCWLHSIINSGSVLEQSISSFIPRSTTTHDVFPASKHRQNTRKAIVFTRAFFLDKRLETTYIE